MRKMGFLSGSALALMLGTWLIGHADERTSAPPSAARVADVDALRRRLGLSPTYDALRGLDQIKVAVLDYGFEGVDGVRPYLPSQTVVVEHYDPDFIRRHGLGDPEFRKGFEPGNMHGRMMAQLVWGVSGLSPAGPKFFLLNANGPTLFRRAVRYAIENKIDIILFSNVFEGGNNFDGKGPMNRVVDEALKAGIIWINAAGNFGRQVYNGPITTSERGWVQLGSAADGALHFRNRLDENQITVTLTWNDYRDTEDAGTLKDLDLFVEDPNGRTIGSGELIQIAPGEPMAPGRSRNPRERVVLNNLAGDRDRDYRIRVRARSGRFSPEDRLRVLVTASRTTALDDPQNPGATRAALELREAQGAAEIFPPADHPGVITVGDAGAASSIGPTADNRLKPDVLIPDATVTFTNGEVTAGSSNAAAIFAGIVAGLKGMRPELTSAHVHRYLGILARNPATTTSGYRPTPRAEGLPATTDGTYRSRDGRIIVYSPRPPAEFPTAFPRYRDSRNSRALWEYDWEQLQGRLPPSTALNTPRPGLPTLSNERPGTAAASDRPRPGVEPTLAERVHQLLARRQWRTPSWSELSNLVNALP